MKIFRWIRNFFGKIRSSFQSEKSGLDKEAIRNPLGMPVTDQELNKEGIAPQTKILRRVFASHEIDQELRTLDQKLVEIQSRQKQIRGYIHPKGDSVDKDIEELERIVKQYENQHNLKLSTLVFDHVQTLSLKVENFISDQALTKIFKKRESEKIEQFKKFKKEIESIQDTINKYIDQNAFVDAKMLIRKLETLLGSIQTLSIKTTPANEKKNNQIVSSLIDKTLALKTKLVIKEDKLIAEKYADELNKHKERIERERLDKEAKIEAERQRKKEEELVQRQQEETIRRKEEEKKLKLQKLLTKKSNWQEFAQVLQENGITKFFHFTDRSNISSIKKNGGLFSWYYCDRNDIKIDRPGGSMQSRYNDTTNNKSDYVRLAFNKEHPMLWIAHEKEGRITDPVWLEVDIEVAFFEQTEFADKNAAAFKAYTPNIGRSIQYLKNIRFDILRQAEIFKHYNLSETEKRFNQAEVLVKTWVPTQYIVNINQF